MTLDQVRELHRLGFGKGSHTRTHADTGKVSKEQSLNEFAHFRMKLEEQLLAPVTLSAYLCGILSNLNEENRELVKVAGYSCYRSCFGGLNTTEGRTHFL